MFSKHFLNLHFLIDQSDAILLYLETFVIGNFLLLIIKCSRRIFYCVFDLRHIGTRTSVDLPYGLSK